jgi:hypothetical protein
MASLVQWLKFAGARDATTGAAIASGFAYFYSPTAPGVYLTVYQDAAETTPYPTNTPVALNAAGQAEVYIKDSAEILITDALGVTKHLVVNSTRIAGELVTMTGTNFSLSVLTIVAAFNMLASSLGPEGQYSADATAYARDYKDAVRTAICPQDYGAVGDGLADDTDALQEAIDSAVALGIPLHLAAGTYKVTDGLVVNGLLDIFGDGRGRSAITAASEAFDVLTISTGSTTRGCSFRDFDVIATYANGVQNSAIACDSPMCSFERMALAAGIGLNLSGADCSAIDLDITVKGASGTSGEGIALSVGSSALRCRVIAIKPSGAAAYSYGFMQTTDRTKVIDCTVTNAAVGFFQTGGISGANLAIGCSALGCGYGFSFNGARCGAVGCVSVSNETEAFTDIDGYGHVDVANSWANGIGDAVNYVASSTGAVTFTFDPTKSVNVFKWNYSGTSGAITVAWPSPAPPIPVGKEYTFIIQVSASGYNASTTVFPSAIKQTGLPTTLSVSTCYTAKFVAAPSGVLVQATPDWSEIHEVVW